MNQMKKKFQKNFGIKFKFKPVLKTVIMQKIFKSIKIIIFKFVHSTKES